MILVTPEHIEISSALRFGFRAFNNEVEYETLLAGLRLAKEMGEEKLKIFSDSQLIVNQVTFEVRELLINFVEYTITQVSREENNKVDALPRLASTTYAGLNGLIPVEFLQNPSINHEENKEINLVNTIGSWIDPIISYLKDKKLPDHKDKARKIRLRSARYMILGDVQYKRGYSLPYLRCLNV